MIFSKYLELNRLFDRRLKEPFLKGKGIENVIQYLKGAYNFVTKVCKLLTIISINFSNDFHLLKSL